jgi:subtilisin-like proprotein convertase family protein
MLRIPFVFFALWLLLPGYSQQWLSLQPAAIMEEVGARILPVSYQLAGVGLMEVQTALREERIDLMLPDGSLHTFRSTKHTNFAPGLEKRYPAIQTYLLQDLSNPRIRGRLDLNPQGMHVVLQHPDGEVYIDPYRDNDPRYYLVYHTRHYQVDPEIRALYANHEHHFIQNEADFIRQKPVRSPFARSAAEEVVLRTFRIAISCTGEYTQKHGGTKEGALAAINTALNRINFVLESELALRLQLIENNDNLIFLDGTDDPFTNGSPNQMALENNNYLIANLGTANFDVGHVFGTSCNTVVGVSGGIGIVCSGSMKGFGASCEISTSDRFYIGVVCHELGHQFGAQHTWNNCPTAPDEQFNSRTAFEPGSGSTIMSYAGACGDQNIAFDSDSYYHSNSIEDILTFLASTGSQCSEDMLTPNRKPSVTIDLEDGFYIPVSTPFKLTAIGNDEDGDSITYSWEQFDPGVGIASFSPIDNPKGDAPIFRSQPPVSNPIRYFPDLDKILNNNYDNTEVLPTYDRKLTFRATVRDHAPGGGGVSWDQLFFRATQQAGPFRILDAGIPDSLTAGSYFEISWDVAGTNLLPIDCQTVNILLSVDGGQTFTDTLVTNTANDGREFVLIPDLETNAARIMIEAGDNIFFDINDSIIVVYRSLSPGFALDLVPHAQSTCLPSTVAFTLESFAIGGFQDSVSLVRVDIPEEVQVLSPLTFYPGDHVAIELDFSGVVRSSSYPLTFYFTSSLGDTIERSVTVQTFSSDFITLSLREPSQGKSAVTTRPTFSWQGSVNAESYILEVSETPAFENAIVAEAGSITTVVLDTLLKENTLYYWRVRPINSCGQGDFTPISAFHTVNLSCEEFTATDLPKALSQSGIVTIQSDIMVGNTGTVSDVNITAVKGFHESFGDLIFSLRSPQGTVATLVNKQCGFTNRTFSLGFDDQSLSPFDCQASFDGLSFQPMSPLAVFEGEPVEGIWSLLVADSVIGSGGRIEGWTLELCGSLSPVAPSVVRLDTLVAQYAGVAVLDNEVMEITDDAAGPAELLFTLVTVPGMGVLQLNGIDLVVGDHFSQQDINQGALTYRHYGQDSLPDSFILTVIDGQGGWAGPLTVPVRISTEVVATHDRQLTGFKIYPNPSQKELHLRNEKLYTGEAHVRIFNTGGQVLWKEKIQLAGLQSIEVQTLPVGIYVLQIATVEGVVNHQFIKH